MLDARLGRPPRHRQPADRLFRLDAIRRRETVSDTTSGVPQDTSTRLDARARGLGLSQVETRRSHPRQPSTRNTILALARRREGSPFPRFSRHRHRSAPQRVAARTSPRRPRVNIGLDLALLGRTSPLHPRPRRPRLPISTPSRPKWAGPPRPRVQPVETVSGTSCRSSVCSLPAVMFTFPGTARARPCVRSEAALTWPTRRNLPGPLVPSGQRNHAPAPHLGASRISPAPLFLGACFFFFLFSRSVHLFLGVCQHYLWVTGTRRKKATPDS